MLLALRDGKARKSRRKAVRLLQSACDGPSGMNPLPFISTVRPQSVPDFDQPASTILRRPKCLSGSTHQPLKMLSDLGYAWLAFRFRPQAVGRGTGTIRPKADRHSQCSTTDSEPRRGTASTTEPISSVCRKNDCEASSEAMRHESAVSFPGPSKRVSDDNVGGSMRSTQNASEPKNSCYRSKKCGCSPCQCRDG